MKSSLIFVLSLVSNLVLANQGEELPHIKAGEIVGVFSVDHTQSTQEIEDGLLELLEKARLELTGYSVKVVRNPVDISISFLTLDEINMPAEIRSKIQNDADLKDHAEILSKLYGCADEISISFSEKTCKEYFLELLNLMDRRNKEVSDFYLINRTIPMLDLTANFDLTFYSDDILLEKTSEACHLDTTQTIQVSRHFVTKEFSDFINTNSILLDFSDLRFTNDFCRNKYIREVLPEAPGVDI